MAEIDGFVQTCSPIVIHSKTFNVKIEDNFEGSEYKFSELGKQFFEHVLQLFAQDESGWSKFKLSWDRKIVNYTTMLLIQLLENEDSLEEPQMFRLNYFCRKLLDDKAYLVADYYAFELFLKKLNEFINSRNLNQKEDWNSTQQRLDMLNYEQPEGFLAEAYLQEMAKDE